MRLIFFFFILLFISNCSLNKDSQYWTEDTIKKKNEQKKLSKILKKSKDITSMTLNEYKLYIEDYTKKSKYPDISK
ncbi:hypothetical protein IDH07_02335 [Pelagibacterales bacterium SAG-MED04]|nr:hypothetical protein [Pelagibacterales bacterium SAG-MED04]